MVAYAYNPKTWKDEAEELHQVQGQSDLHREFQQCGLQSRIVLSQNQNF